MDLTSNLIDGFHHPKEVCLPRIDATGRQQLMAEREGFEPPDGYPSTVFKTAAFDHSATSP